MEMLILLISTLLSFSLQAQELDQVAYDITTFLEQNELVVTPSADCNALSGEVQTDETNEYQCGAPDDVATDDPTQTPPTIVELPKTHPLRQKHKIQFLSVGVKFKLVNDNHQGDFIGLKGDDDGNTFGGDIGLNTEFARGQDRLRIGVNYSLRQYTKPLSGGTRVNSATGEKEMWYYDSEGKYQEALLESGNAGEYSEDTYLYNQASLSSTILNVDLMLDKPQFDKKFGYSYGVKLGVQTLNDTPTQAGSNLQDNHHSSTDIYRFESRAFSNLLVNGVYHYLQVEPQMEIRAPELKFAGQTCSLKASTHFSVLFNTLLEKDQPSQRLSFVEPKLNTNLTLGIIPLKYSNKSVIEVNSALNLDPLNKLPRNANPGVIGTADLGLKINGNIGKNISFYVIPIEFYMPLNNANKTNNMLSGETVTVGHREIQAKQLENDVVGAWGEVGLVIKLNPKSRR